MLFRFGSVPVLLTAALIAGCAQQASAPPPSASAVTTAAPVQTAALPAGSFDGSYGARTGIQGGAHCGTTRFGFPLMVKDGQAALRTITAGTLEGPVAPDGTVQLQSRGVTLNGKITGNKFSGELAMGLRGGTCSFPLEYTKYTPRAS